jgi:DNA-binding beta-propeller fold protein YncE
MRISTLRLLAGAAAVLSFPSLALAAPPESSTGLRRAELGSAPYPARGGAVVLDRDALVAYVADTDNEALHHVDLSSGFVTTTKLACAPEQVALLGDGRVAVSLRACNRVDVLAVDLAGEAAVVASTEVAPEPFGLAVTPGGDLLVTSAWGHALTLLDGDTLAARFSVDLPRAPRGVAVTADGRRAFVTHAVGDSVSVVDLDPATGSAPRHVFALGGRYRNQVDRAIGAGTLHPGASLAFSAVLDERGTRLFVPHLAVQNGASTQRVVSSGYGGVPVQELTSVASVAVISVRDERLLGAPLASSSPDLADVAPFFQPTAAPVGAPCRQATAAALLGDALFVTSYGTDELVELDARSIDPALAPRRVLKVGAGPAGVDVDPRTGIAVVFNRFSHDLSVVSLGSGDVDTIPVASDPLPPDLAAGRRLFYTERDPHISRDARACASCHPDGRDDGLTWKLDAGPRQTPTLVGRLDHGPFGWSGRHARLEDNMRETMTRLGAGGMPDAQVKQLAAFLRRGLLVPKRPAPTGAQAALAERGRHLFESTSVGCSGCHVLDREGSDRKRHEVGSAALGDVEEAFRTPPLVFVGETAPYFHDGRYATLEALLDDNIDRMGSTTQLKGEDRAALLAFLRTL